MYEREGGGGSLFNKENFILISSTLQVILNDFREKIEKYNGELVELLMLKDELSNEQESMLIGKRGCPHYSKRCLTQSSCVF